MISVFRNSYECRKFHSAIKNHGRRLTVGFDTSTNEIVGRCARQLFNGDSHKYKF